MSNDRHYLEQVAAMRQSKQREEIAMERNQAIYSYQQSLQSRQEIERQAACTNDPDEQQYLRDQWHYFDAELQRAEQDIRRFTPPQISLPCRKSSGRFCSEIKLSLREGQRGVAAMDLAHNYLVSRGYNPSARGFNEKIRTLLEMYGGNLQQITGGQCANVRFDPQEQSLTATEAAKISGLSPERYNQYARAAYAQGRFSYQQKK